MKEDSYFYIPQLKKRNQKAKRFKYICMSSLFVAVLFLAIFLFDMISKGYGAFTQTYINIPVNITKQTVEFTNLSVDKQYFPLVSRAWFRDLPSMVKKDPSLMNTKKSHWVLANSNVDQYLKGKYSRLKPKQISLVDKMEKDNLVKKSLNSIFFSKGDSKIPEYSGFLASMAGTVMTMIVTMVVAVPIGVLCAIYLEEFSTQNKWTTLIEININNLAAIPSILFGMLGLAVFINFFGVPRSTPIAGGITLALMSLPVIIVSTKAALKAVPESIRQAGFGLGLTKWQIVRDHVIPLALPGILTGSIIALAQAVGETAPLIMVGMIAFIPDVSFSFTEATTVMPAQIFTWSGMPERAYIERTAAGILVLLAILLVLNSIAIYLRKKYAKTW